MHDRRKLHVLDGLRGFAACAVMIFHLGSPFTFQLFPHGYLAVDFFFMLSGFVMAMAYQGKLDANSWSTFRFMQERVARLYPLYFVGIVLGFLFTVLQIGFGAGKSTLGSSFVAFLFGAAFLPNFPAMRGGNPNLFPFNLALWSLFFEMVAYVCHGVFLRRRTSRFLGWMLGISWLWLAWEGVSHGSLDFGLTFLTIPGGFARIAFAYSSGLIVYRLWRSGFWRTQVSPLLLSGALLGLLAERQKVPQYDLFVVTAVFPCLLLAGAYSVERAWMRLPCVKLGELSYALYVIHLPMLALMQRTLVHTRIVLPYPMDLVLMAAVVIGTAFCLERLYDVPVRSYLNKRIREGARGNT